MEAIKNNLMTQDKIDANDVQIFSMSTPKTLNIRNKCSIFVLVEMLNFCQLNSLKF